MVPSHLVRLQSLILSALLAVSLTAAPNSWSEETQQADFHGVAINKSPNDKRDYRYLNFGNGLKVVLVSDATAEKSAAALDVNVGSGDDPADRGGLAHFLEHMLFLGTEKYPEPGEYQNFISTHSGSHNAYTSAEHTNYFFTVDSNHFEEALDRFAQFFVAPLFSTEYVDRERHAVHSEYKSKIKNDYRRQLDVYRHLVNSSHPIKKFSVGSLDTLADREGSSVRQALLAFYEDYYSADQMTLVVLGRDSLDELEVAVRTKFEGIAKRATNKLMSGTRLFDKNFLPARVHIESVKDIRTLSLVFPVMPSEKYYRQKPLQYIGNILGHEGKGSLLSLLKELGWAEGLSAGAGMGGRNQGTFNISITLTTEGLINQSKVVATVFKMIEKVRKEGVEQWRFDEQKQLANIAFQFAEKSEPIHVVSDMANKLHRFEPEDVIRGAYAFDEFDQSLISSYLAKLNPSNLLWTISTEDAETDQQSQYYQTPYGIEALTMETASLAVADLAKLTLPQANHFIPSRLEIKSLPTLGEPHNKPSLLMDSERISLWHKQAVEFSVPRSVLHVRALSPQIGVSVESQAMAHLYAALVRDSLNEFSYPAALAGLGFSIGANSRGLDVTISGYSDRQGLMLDRILEVMETSRFSEQRFDSIKSELVRHWSNASEAPPYEQLMAQLPVALYAPLWSSQDRAVALQSLDFSQMQDFSRHVWDGAKIKMLTTGNLYQQEALKLAAVVETKLKTANATEEQSNNLVPAEVVKLEDGVQDRLFVGVDHQDVAAVYYVQALGSSVEDRAMTLMQQQMLRPSFFNQLRTEKQLGYLVFVSGMQLKDIAGTLFVVQSPALMLADLELEISGYVLSKAGVVDDFEKNQQALITALTQVPKNLGEQAGRYWSEILGGSDDFSRREALIDAVRGLTPEAYSSYSKKMLGDSRGLWMVAATADGTLAADLSAEPANDQVSSKVREEGGELATESTAVVERVQGSAVSTFKDSKPKYSFP